MIVLDKSRNVVHDSNIINLYSNDEFLVVDDPENGKPGYFTLKTATFLKTTPPQTFPSTIFSSQALQNGLKIYVPDQSIEAYKAKQPAYANYIYPMSQKA